MICSEKIDQLAPALALAQAESTPATKDSTNPHFRNTYASLESIWQACRAALRKHGFSVLQSCDPNGEAGALLTTTLLHTSGQWCRVQVVLPIEKPSVQAVGSAMTYGRRYGLAAAMGIVAEDDDDGEHATTFQPRGNDTMSRQAREANRVERPTAQAQPEMTVEAAVKVLWGKEKIPLGDLRNTAVSQALEWSAEKIEEQGEKPNLVRIHDAAALILAAREAGTLTEPPKTSKARGTYSPPDPSPYAPAGGALEDEDDDLPF